MREHNEDGYTPTGDSEATGLGYGSEEATSRPLPGPAKAELKPGGQTCQCAECGLFFTGVDAFDLHRYGEWDKRKCRTVAKMREMGMSANENGVWARGAYRNPKEEDAV